MFTGLVSGVTPASGHESKMRQLLRFLQQVFYSPEGSFCRPSNSVEALTGVNEMRYDIIRYHARHLGCAEKLTDSQLNLSQTEK